MKKNKNILSDHKKIGQKFYPPFLTGFDDWETNFQPVVIQKEVVPEIIWIAYVIDDLGLEESADLLFKFLRSLDIIVQKEGLKDFCFLSNYQRLNINDIQNIRSYFEGTGWFSQLRFSLQKFNQILPQNPLNHIFMEIPDKCQSNIDFLKKILSELNSKRRQLYVYSVTNIFLIKNKLDQIKLTREINLPPPIAIMDYPHTEESLRLASFVRASIYPMIRNGTVIEKSEWKNDFWKYANDLEPIQIKSLYYKSEKKN